MTFYRRHGIVQANQWQRAGDHKRVGPGVRADGGILDLEVCTPWSRRFVEPGDWIVTEGNGKCSVLSPAEFARCYTET